MENIKITTKLSRLKCVSSTEDDYLEAATGGILKNFVIFTVISCRPASALKRDSNTGLFLCILRNFSEYLF